MTDLDILAADVRTHAAKFDNAWDRQAVEWPLTSASIVVEVGGYTGRWALQIADRYAPRLYVFEPQGWAYGVCCEVLRDRAVMMQYGLGTHDGWLPMSHYETDGCSFVGGDGPLCEVREVSNVFQFLLLDHIDLMLMNIEGYEYTLIPHMLERGIYPDRLMVQFHPHQPEDDRTMAIYDQLEACGYRVVWTYGIVLTAWERTA